METLDDTLAGESADTGRSTDPELRLVAALRARVFPGVAATRSSSTPEEFGGPDSVPGRLGRYAVLRELGRGGMGVVYVCYDEQLERKVAVKLLRARMQDEVARARLEREAQALARLSHPNVVQIHELGDHHGAVFVAMELVDGETLRAWLARNPPGSLRPWSTTVEVLRQAGAGLVAAHEQGLVHRDFKPDNVMIGADGRVRVLDFGLVRHVSDRSELDSSEDIGFDRSSPTNPGLDETEVYALTRVGSVMGTPAYMAPEQFRARPGDASADQFSFCVLAFEALFGCRPFAGDTLSSLSTAVCGGQLVVPPDQRGVPRRLRATILRGLCVEPRERWPDMATLLAQLDDILARERLPRRMLKAAALVALVLGAGAVGMRVASSQPGQCVFDESALAGTWDDESRRALRTAVASHPQYFGDETLDAIDGELTSWGRAWLASRTRVCEATRVAGSQSEALLDLRTSCLDRQQRETRAVVTLLTSADGSGLARPFDLLGQLPDLAVCEDPRLAETSHPLPTEPKRREAILAVYEGLARVRGLSQSAQVDEAEALVDALSGPADALGYLPLSIEQRALAAERGLWRQRLDESVPALHEVIHEAEVAGLDELSASLRTRLATQVVGQWGPPAVQEIILQEARTAVDRLGRASDPRRVDLELAQAAWLEDRGQYEAALTGYRAVVDSARARGAEAAVGRARRLEGLLLVELGRFAEAEQAYRDAAAAFESIWGPGTTFSGPDLELQLGLVDLARGQFEAAQTHFKAARSGFDPLLGAGVGDQSVLDLAEAKLAFMRGDLDAAHAGFVRVTQTSIDDLRRAEAWDAVGVVRFYQGDIPGSLEAYREARPLLEATLGPDHPRVGISISNIGESLAASGDHESALSSFADALEILERALPPDHTELALPYKGRAQSRLALGQVDGARADLERALSLYTANAGEPVERADVEFSLARVLDDAGEHQRASELAEAARQRLDGHGHGERAAEISAWVARHD